VSLETLKESLEKLNEDAINQIKDNFKNIIDGGSNDMKLAMDNFDRLKTEALEKLREINKLTQEHREDMDKIDMEISLSTKELG
jgi:uncharacterized protein YggL (DUF469 family)